MHCHSRGSSLTVIVVNAWVKDERGNQGHTSARLLHQCATWHRAVNTHCFYTSAFLTLCFPLAAMDGKIGQRVCIKFCVKLRKSVTETFEMLCEAFGKHSWSWKAVSEWHSCSEVGQGSVEDDGRSGWPSTSKMTENIEKIWELIHEDHRRTIHELTDTVRISYGVCQIVTENLNMCHITCPYIPENHSLRLTTWLSLPILLTHWT
jgi:hypothetical protein